MGKSGTVAFFLFIVILIAIPAVILSPGDHLLDISDLPVFYTGASMLAHGRGAHIYDAQAFLSAKGALFPGHNKGPLFYTPPLAVPLLLPLLLFPPAVAAVVCPAVLIVCLAVSICILAGLLKLTRRQTIRLAVVVAFAGPVWEAIRTAQQSCILLLALVLVVVWAKKKKTSAGLVQSLFLFKPHLLLPLLAYELGAQQWLLLAGTFAVTAFLTAVSLLLLGPHGWTAYLHMLQQEVVVSQSLGAVVEPDLHGQLLRSGIPVETASRAAEICFVAGLFVCLWLGRRFRADSEGIKRAMWLVMPISIALALHVHNYDLLLLLPGVLFWWQQPPRQNLSTGQRALILLPLLIFEMPIYVAVHYRLVQHGFPINPFFVVLAAYLAGGVLSCLPAATTTGCQRTFK